MKITVELSLGSGMTAVEVADAITKALIRQSASALDPLSQHECGAICDGDGNAVGEWRVSES